jgi:phosphatidylserine decarboxylase
MFQRFNQAIYFAPAWEDKPYLVGRPINAVIATCMQTPAGREIFNDKDVNAYLKKLFDVWVVCLTTKKSRLVLNKLALPEVTQAARDFAIRQPGKFLEFKDAFKCNPDDPHYGFQCWDDFFVRPLKDGIRPIPGLTSDNNLITCACESHLYRIASGVKREDDFCIKDKAYSLQQMLNYDSVFVDKFVGGTVFQTYLSPRDYHRWHSPVKGTVKKVVQIPGTYYSVYPDITDDPAPNELSVGFLPHVATRVLIYIQADNPKSDSYVSLA